MHASETTEILNAIKEMHVTVTSLTVQVALNTQSNITVKEDLDTFIKNNEKDRDKAIDIKIIKCELRYVLYLFAGLATLNLYMAKIAIPGIVKMLLTKGG